jgi:Xaa-Pro aminopeptidase
MTDVVMFADTLRSPELRHEVPIAAPDPFIYVEARGRRHVFAGSLEVPRLAALDGGVHVEPLETLGVDDLIAAGWPRHAIDEELVLRACRELGVVAAAAPRSFPLAVADHLRANGVDVRPDGTLFDARRRAKTELELAGIQRAQRACEEAMDAIRTVLRERGPGVTCEELRADALEVFAARGVGAEDLPIVSHGAQTVVGHEVGSGPITEGEPVVVDLFPRDTVSGCFADMSRTFCLGDPPEELVEYHRLSRRALELAVSLVRPGATGQELHAAVCDLFEEAGYATQRTKQPGAVLAEGFYHSLGHGVGLEVHEEPILGRTGTDPFVPGDVLAVEPGLYRLGFGGCRLEDLVLVTESGCEVLTSYRYELEP